MGSKAAKTQVNDPEAERRLRLCLASPLKHLLDTSTVPKSLPSAFPTLFIQSTDLDKSQVGRANTCVSAVFPPNTCL